MFKPPPPPNWVISQKKRISVINLSPSLRSISLVLISGADHLVWHISRVMTGRNRSTIMTYIISLIHDRNEWTDHIMTYAHIGTFMTRYLSLCLSRSCCYGHMSLCNLRIVGAVIPDMGICHYAWTNERLTRSREAHSLFHRNKGKDPSFEVPILIREGLWIAVPTD